MLPEHDNYGPFPQSGEIDIAEAVNIGAACDDCSDRIHAAVHHGATLEAIQTFAGSTPYTAADAFHVFAIDWSPDRLIWFVDDRPYFSQDGGRPFDQRFYLILNLAVGGLWAENAGTKGIDDGSFPATVLIDWVRVYSNAPADRAGTSALPPIPEQP